MTHLLRNVIALGCFAGLATVYGCSAQTGPEGSDPQEVDGTPVGVAQEAGRGSSSSSSSSSGGVTQFNSCNISQTPIPVTDPCGSILCGPVGDTFCCKTEFDGQCVNEALSFCRNLQFPFSPAQAFCTSCPGTPTIFNPFPFPNICSVLSVGFDFGCPGASWDENLPPPGCAARVCEQSPLCCEQAWNDTNNCRVLADRLCQAGCGVSTLSNGNGNNGKGNGKGGN